MRCEQAADTRNGVTKLTRCKKMDRHEKMWTGNEILHQFVFFVQSMHAFSYKQKKKKNVQAYNALKFRTIVRNFRIVDRSGNGCSFFLGHFLYHGCRFAATTLHFYNRELTYRSIICRSSQKYDPKKLVQ